MRENFMRGNVWMEVRKDAMAVVVRILPEGEREITEELLHQALADQKVRFGIDEDMIAYIVQNGEYGRSYQVAAGTPPVSGSEGYYEYFFERDSREFEPKIRKDGSVDYSPSIRVVEIGAKVAEYHPAKPGNFGYTVFEEKIAPPVSRELSPLQCINVERRGNEYYATARGRIGLRESTLEVRSNLTIDGDAGYAMGTISFNGDVIVNGDVFTDVVIHAGGNITVEGVVEGALLKAGGNIIVHHGIHGKHKAVIEAGGSITSNFIEEAKVTAGTDICVDYMVNTKVSAGQTVLATGKNGLIIGGDVSAGETVDAFVIGNEAGSHTKISVDCGDTSQQVETGIIVRKRLYAGAEIHVNGVRAARMPVFGEFHNVDGEVKYFDIGSYAYRMKEGQQDGRKAEREKPLILIVDDDPVILRTEYAYLCEDYRVAAVSEPKDALLYLKRNKPDLVLLDYLMPRMNGGELLQKIREDDDKKVANVSVFFVTSVTDRRVVAECLSLYPQGYLLKPLNREELKKIVGKFFAHRESEKRK